jgi:hypothetical protein
MKEKITNRIIGKARMPELLEVLTSRISLSDLQSLLLEVYQKRIKSLSPRHLVEQYTQNRFVQMSGIDPRTRVEFDRLAYSILPPGFEVVELSPVCPLGTNSIIAPVDQNNALTTIRNTEVIADSTNVMALECARRRRKWLHEKEKRQTRVKLCASHRLIRTQVFDSPDAFPHFLVFGLCTAGRDTGSLMFEKESLYEHIDFYIHLLTSAIPLGIKIHDPRVVFLVYDENWTESIQNKVIVSLAKKHTGIKFDVSSVTDKQTYYQGVRFQIYAEDEKGTDYFLVDGGFTDWTQKLLSNRKERLLISGLGSERLLVCFEP